MKEYGEIKHLEDAGCVAIMLRTDIFPNGVWLTERALSNRISALRSNGEDVTLDEDARRRLMESRQSGAGRS